MVRTILDSRVERNKEEHFGTQKLICTTSAEFVQRTDTRRETRGRVSGEWH